MLGVVFVRRLRDGKTYDDFRGAWYPDSGFGVPARIVSGPGVTDPREVEEVVESTELRTFFVVEGDHDFTGFPAPLADEHRGFLWA